MSVTLSDKELRRYGKQIVLPEIGKEGQLLLKKARVLVVGVGGLGTPVLQYLTAAGVGHIGIVDNDTVAENNLQRQILFGNKDLGKLKAIIARERLAVLNNLVDFKIHNVRLSSGNILDIFGNYDIVVDATDNFPVRYLINDACIIKKIPWIHGAIYRYEGQLSVFNYRNGPTYRCLYPEVPAEGSYMDPAESGMLGVLPGMIGCYQASEAIKVITGFGDVLSGILMSIDIQNNSIQTFTIHPVAKNKQIKSL